MGEYDKLRVLHCIALHSLQIICIKILLSKKWYFRRKSAYAYAWKVWGGICKDRGIWAEVTVSSWPLRID